MAQTRSTKFGFFLNFGASSPSVKPRKLFKSIGMGCLYHEIAERLRQVSIA